MSADVRFWLYLGFFLYNLYCLLKISSSGCDDEEDLSGGRYGTGYESPEKNIKQRKQLAKKCRSLMR